MELTTLAARLALGKKYAAKYLLDSALVCAVAEQESSWNPWAVRYEPLFFGKYIQPLVNSGIVTTATEAHSRAFSYGVMQVMGQVARELGFAGRFLSQLCDPETGMDLGCKKLRQCCDRHSDNAQALLAYNGGGDSAYPHLVMDRMRTYY